MKLFSAVTIPTIATVQPPIGQVSFAASAPTTPLTLNANVTPAAPPPAQPMTPTILTTADGKMLNLVPIAPLNAAAATAQTLAPVAPSPAPVAAQAMIPNFCFDFFFAKCRPLF